jgi:myo-inositol-1(or 4)-monophosphatase
MPPAPESELAALLALARELAAEAGALVAAGAKAGFAVATKSTATDMVTEVDRASEALIVGRLRAARPSDAIVAEEGAGHTGTSGVCWYIDPVDGTTNFVYGYPHYAVSIGVEVDGERVAGVVHNAAIGETFWAAKGQGAFLDGRPIHVSGKADLPTALLGTGFGYEPGFRARQALVVGRLLGRVRDLRRSGSAALDLCSVACGRIDAYYEQPLSSWDYSAGDVIVREAGGVVESVGGGPIARGSVLATSPALLTPLRALLRESGAVDTWP